MRVRMRRRSVSSFVSPGPCVPMPPPSRDSAAPDADEPRQQVFQLRELDLQLAFARPRAAREDVEDELRAIDDLAADRFFDLPQLRRRQLVVEDDDVGVGLGARRGKRRRSCPSRGTSTDRASGAPAARAARPRRRPPRRGRPVRRASARRRAVARGRRSARRAPRVRAGRLSRDRGAGRRLTATQPCLNLFPRIAPARTSARRIRSRRQSSTAARPASPGVDQQVDVVAERVRDRVGIVGRRHAPLTVRARRRQDEPDARHSARATACAGTRTPTRPVPPVTAAAQRRGAAISSVKRPRPERAASAPASGGSGPSCGDLRVVGGNERQRLLGAASLCRERRAPTASALNGSAASP